MATSVPTPAPARKSHRREHTRPRSFIAGNVIRERVANGSRRCGKVLDHVAALVGLVKQGRAGAVVRGGHTARHAGAGVGLAIRGQWGIHEGRGVDLLRVMHRLGYLPTMAAAPNEDTAGRAMMLLAEKTPLVQVVRRGWYRIYACDPSFMPAEIVDAIVDMPPEAASRSASPVETPKNQADSAATDGVDCWPWPDELVSSGSPASPEDLEKVPFCGDLCDTGQRSALRVHGDPTVADPTAPECLEDPAADTGATEHAQPGGLGCAPSCPADAASPAVALLTHSGWLQALPKHQRQRQAVLLAFSPVADREGLSECATIRARLEQRVSTERGRRVSSREVAAITRGALALRLRGLLDEHLRPPEFAVHPTLAAFGIRPQPSAERPTAAQADWCHQAGVDTAGLSRGEVRAIQRHVESRVQAVRLGRLLRRHGAAWSFAQEHGPGRVGEALGLAVQWVQQRTRGEIAAVVTEAMPQ